jgi:toxin ParE1/3/4
VTITWSRTGRRTRIVQTDHIARDNPVAAARIDEEIERQVRQLRDHPLMGRSGRVPGTRELVISRTAFIVVYRVTPTRIEILRVLHGAQAWPETPESDGRD